MSFGVYFTPKVSSKRMNTSIAYFCRWILATIVVFGAMQQCETFSFTQKPPRIVRALEGTWKSLIWDFTATTRKYSVSFSRQRPGEKDTEQIAKRSESSSFNYVKDSYKRDYAAFFPATLSLTHVKRGENYVYTLSILDESDVLQLSDNVTVEVVVLPRITLEREPQLAIGENYTLICNASGNPPLSITWTKDGVPVNQFNASGYFLHLVNVQREDAGSYRCTASNGYGKDAISFSIVGINCSDCISMKVGIEIRSESLMSAFQNQSSTKFKTLESKLLSAIWSVYTKNPDKQLYRVNVDYFRSDSVFATVDLLFEKSVTDPLKPLEDEMNDGKLGPFTVDRTLVENPITDGPPQPHDTGVRRSSGLTESEMWGILGGIIALVLLTGIVVLICCICRLCCC